MKTYRNRLLITYVIFFILLVSRIPLADIITNFAQLFGISTLPYWIESLRSVQGWTYYLYERWSFVLAGVIIIVNRKYLKDIQIDQFTLIIFICCGLAYCRYYFLPSGWLAALLSILMIILGLKKRFLFGNLYQHMFRLILIILNIFFFGLIISRSLTILKAVWAIHWFLTEIPFVVVEEIIFRGILWMLLRDLKFSTQKIVALQALFFWFVHANDMFIIPVFFWIIVPIASIVLGIIVWRSKSITPSITAHILFNILWWLI